MEKKRDLTFGAALKSAREAAGLGLREVSDVTKIQIRYIEALEGEDWPRVPPGVIGRGFVRLLAREIGADTDEFIKIYCAARGEDPPRLMIPTPEENWRVGQTKPLIDPKVFFFVGGILLAVAVVALLLWSPWSAKKPVLAQRGAESVVEKTHRLEVRALADAEVTLEIQGLPVERHLFKSGDAPFVIELAKPVRVETANGKALAIFWDGAEVKTQEGTLSMLLPNDLEAPKP